MLGLAAVFALVRVGVTVAEPQVWETSLPRLDTLGLIATWTMLDGLLVGLAIGTMPLASLHRHPTTRAVIPALAALAVLLAAPAVAGPVVTVGVRTINAIALTALVLAATAIFSLPAPVDRVLAGPWLHRIGARSFGLFLWHIPFAYALAGGDPFRWQGVTVFVVVLTLSLAAATVSYRSIELPAQSTLQWLVRRWFPSDVIVLTTPAPQREKWRRWDEISLDNLPRPVRRRNPSVSVGRLWQHGDRTTIDEGDSNTGPDVPPGESAVAG
jgi:peptidoglycan/LPS O-acetylase OafA/YrhL